MIKSKKNTKYYIGQSLLLILSIGVGSIIAYASFDSFTKNDNHAFLYLACSVVLIISPLIGAISFYRKVPDIKISEREIEIGKVKFKTSDISNLNLNCKLKNGSEGSIVTLKNGKEIKYSHDFYSNLGLLNKELHSKVNDEKVILSMQIDESKPHQSDKSVSYKGPYALSFNWLFSWIVNSLIIYVHLFMNPPIGFTIISILFGGALFITFSFGLYYIEISEQILSIKNIHFFWFYKTFELSNIKEIVFEDNRINRIRIITKNFDSYVFAASSLAKKNWKELETDLTNKNIKVRNDNILIK